MNMNDILISGVETADTKRINYAFSHSAKANCTVAISNLSAEKAWKNNGFKEVTPLIIATAQNTPHIIDLLMKHGASLDTPVTADNITFSNVLALAAFKSNYTTFSALLKHAKPEDIKNAHLIYKGKSFPLPHTLVTMYSPYNPNRLQILKDFLENGFDIKQKDQKGYTITMEAAHHKKYDELIIAINHGGNPFEPYPESSLTPYDELFKDKTKEDILPPKLAEIKKLCDKLKEKQNITHSKSRN